MQAILLFGKPKGENILCLECESLAKKFRDGVTLRHLPGGKLIDKDLNKPQPVRRIPPHG